MMMMMMMMMITIMMVMGDGAFVGVYSSTCRGISIATIDASKVKEKDKVRTGYAHAVRNAHHSTAHYLSNNNAEWPFGQDIAGYLMNNNANDSDEHTWVCKRIVEEEKMVRFSFFHKRCTGVRCGQIWVADMYGV